MCISPPVTFGICHFFFYIGKERGSCSLSWEGTRILKKKNIIFFCNSKQGGGNSRLMCKFCVFEDGRGRC